ILAALAAALNYGFSASYMKRFLSGTNSLAVATLSQLSASALLAPLALLNLPTSLPSAKAWCAVVLLGVLCTGFAYAIFFWLLETVGSARATTVTFLVPLFAVTFGSLLLDERVTWDMAIGGSVILAGTALTLGIRLVPRLGARRPPSQSET
ncbi:MAG: EamA family transporter, partial [Betaproteobacteria bacterium]|nr:EamA family transporter [Betaproteobacteria bacterium]